MRLMMLAQLSEPPNELSTVALMVRGLVVAPLGRPRKLLLALALLSGHLAPPLVEMWAVELWHKLATRILVGRFREALGAGSP